MNIKEEIEKPQQGFWKGQFSVEPIRPQIVYDVLFGIIAPILCFWFDPIVFQDSTAPNEGLLGRYKLIVYFFSTIAIGALFLWLFYGNRWQSYAGFLSGILF